eukprot:366014-Chlamydomonas_euryale.AAC.13
MNESCVVVPKARDNPSVQARRKRCVDAARQHRRRRSARRCGPGRARRRASAASAVPRLPSWLLHAACRNTPHFAKLGCLTGSLMHHVVLLAAKLIAHAYNTALFERQCDSCGARHGRCDRWSVGHNSSRHAHGADLRWGSRGRVSRVQ